MRCFLLHRELGYKSVDKFMSDYIECYRILNTALRLLFDYCINQLCLTSPYIFHDIYNIYQVSQNSIVQCYVLRERR